MGDGRTASCNGPRGLCDDTPGARALGIAQGVTVAQPLKVYLAGAINGRPDNECVDWRLKAAELLKPVEVLDPLAQRDCRGRELDPGMVDYIVHGDEQDIRNSDALLVMFDSASVGTSMEMRIAYKEVMIPVYTVDISGRPRSPWLVFHTTRFFDNLKDACEYIVKEHHENLPRW